MTEIKLGDKVKCTHTGFTGIAVAKTEFINGCIQWCLVPKTKTGEKYPEEVSLDEGSLKVVMKGPKHKKEDKRKYNGGPVRRGITMRGF